MSQYVQQPQKSVQVMQTCVSTKKSHCFHSFIAFCVMFCFHSAVTVAEDADQHRHNQSSHDEGIKMTRQKFLSYFFTFPLQTSSCRLFNFPSSFSPHLQPPAVAPLFFTQSSCSQINLTAYMCVYMHK